jgi:hypothetical protein
MKQKAWIDVGSPRFSYLQPIQYIGVRASVTKDVITPTYMTKIEPLKITYTVNVYSQAKNRMCRDEKQKLSSRERRDIKIISQPKRAIPGIKICPFLFSNRHFL